MLKILVIADPSGDTEQGSNAHEPQPALKKALDLAQSTEANIHVVSFCYESLYEVDASYKLDRQPKHASLKELLIDHTKSEWEKQSQSLPQDISLTHEVVWEKYIHQWVIEHCKSNQYDLVVKTGHRSESWIYTPTDWQLFRETVTPVYSVYAPGKKTRSNILVALDLLSGSKDKQSKNERLLEEAARLAEVTGATLHVCAALVIPTLVKDFDLVDVTAKVHELEDDAREAAESYLSRYGIDAKNLHLREGKPWHVINNFAHKLNAQCIVVGTMGRTGVKGKLIGNTAEKVIQQARTDLLVV